MSNTSRWPVTVDGVRLDTFAHNISTRSGRDIPPSATESNIDTGMRHGVIWVPHKKYGPGIMVLKMWVSGTDDDGIIPVDDYEEYVENLDKLKRMFAVRHRMLDVRQWVSSDGLKIRQMEGEVKTVITPEMLAAYPYTTEMTVEFEIPNSFWQDVADTTFDTGAAVGAGTNHTLPSPWTNATAPMLDLYLVLDGPATNPRIIDNRNGHYVQLNQALPNGQQWVVNTRTWSSKTGVGIEFTDGGTDVYGTTVYAGGHEPSLFGIVADPSGPQVRIEGSAFGAGTRLRIRGKIKYL